jgi:hypothetical protein
MFGASDDQIRGVRELSISDLNAMIPRRVRLDPDGGYQALVFILIAIAFGGAWFAWLYHDDAQQWQRRGALRREGREAIAQITKVSGRTRYAHYTFHLGDADYQGEAKLDNQTGPKFPDGRIQYARANQQIPILFLPSDPSVNYPSGWAWWSLWDLAPHLFMLFFSSLGVLGLGNVYRERILASSGWVTEGTVIACAPKGSRFRVDYEFYNEDRQQFDGANEYSDECDTGSKIRVIYLRKNPKKNDTYPMASFYTPDR